MFRLTNLSCLFLLAVSSSVAVYSADPVSIPAQDLASTAPALTLEQAIAWRQDLLNKLQHDRQLIQGAVVYYNIVTKNNNPQVPDPVVRIFNIYPGKWYTLLKSEIQFVDIANWKGLPQVYGGFAKVPIAYIDYKISYSIPGRMNQQFRTTVKVTVSDTFDHWNDGTYYSVQYIPFIEWSKLRDALNVKAVSLSLEIQSLRKQQQAALTIKAAG